MNEAILREVSDSHWDEVLEIRSQMQQKKKLITVFNFCCCLKKKINK